MVIFPWKHRMSSLSVYVSNNGPSLATSDSFRYRKSKIINFFMPLFYLCIPVTICLLDVMPQMCRITLYKVQNAISVVLTDPSTRNPTVQYLFSSNYGWSHRSVLITESKELCCLSELSCRSAKSLINFLISCNWED